jgi:small GTP-binding protein
VSDKKLVQKCGCTFVAITTFLLIACKSCQVNHATVPPKMSNLTSFDKQRMVRFILLGSSGVGKTSILHRFCDGKFIGSTQSTIGVDFKWRDVDVDGEVYRLHVWDTAGQEQFKVIARNYYRQADGALLVYDCTDPHTLEDLQSFIDDARELCPLGVVFVLLGNKVDLASSMKGQVVPRETGESFARRRGIPLFFETSAANGACIDEAFEVLCRHVLNNRRASNDLETISHLSSPARPNNDRRRTGEFRRTGSNAGKGPVKLTDKNRTTQQTDAKKPCCK